MKKNLGETKKEVHVKTFPTSNLDEVFHSVLERHGGALGAHVDWLPKLWTQILAPALDRFESK